MARQLIRMRPAGRSSQAFWMATVLATSGGRAEMIPNRPYPRTLRISVSSPEVHLPPAARPSAMHLPIRTASRLDRYVLLQEPDVARLSVSPHIEISRLIEAVLPLTW